MSYIATTEIEKKFFSYCLYEDNTQFNKLTPAIFKNDNIQLVFTVIKNYMRDSKKNIAPSAEQIKANVELVHKGSISDNIMNEILKNNLEGVDIDWLKPQFQAWKLEYNLNIKVNESLDIIRNVKDLNFETIKGYSNQIKVLYDNINLIDDENEDLGDDFDDYDSHVQDKKNQYIKSGYPAMDELMGGGFGRSTLACFMGETNCGKSMLLYNLAANMSNNGHNVAVVSLEMTKKKVTHRIGCMRFDIHPKKYEEFVKDRTNFKIKLNELRNSISNNIFSSPGRLIVQKYNTCDCTVTDLDVYIKNLQEKKGIKLDVLIVDYLQIMSIEKGVKAENSYAKGKHIAEGLRFLADKYNILIITATQLTRDAWGNNNIELSSVPDSKVIAETCDVIYAIIRTPEMKKQNLFKFKILKLRDNEHHNEEIKFNFNNNNLRIENGVILNNHY